MTRAPRSATVFRYRAWRVVGAGASEGFIPLIPTKDSEDQFLRGKPAREFTDAADFVAFLRATMPGVADAIIRVWSCGSDGVAWTIHLPEEKAVAA